MLISLKLQNSLVKCVHNIPSLQTCWIGLNDGSQGIVLHHGDRNSEAYLKYCVSIDILANPNIPYSVPNKQVIEVDPSGVNNGVIWQESAQASVSCLSMALSGIGVVGAAAAAPGTFGASTVVGVAAWGGFVSSSFQCGTGLYRTFMAATGQLQWLKELEQNPIYDEIISWIDKADLAFGLIPLASSTKRLLSSLRNNLVPGFSSLGKRKKRMVLSILLKKIISQPGGKKKIYSGLKGLNIKNGKIFRLMQNLPKDENKFRHVARVMLRMNMKLAKSFAESEIKVLLKSLRNVVAEDFLKSSLGIAQNFSKEIVAAANDDSGTIRINRGFSQKSGSAVKNGPINRSNPLQNVPRYLINVNVINIQF